MIFKNKSNFRITATESGLKLVLSRIKLVLVEGNIYIDDDHNMWKLMFTKIHDAEMTTYNFFRVGENEIADGGIM